MLPSVAELLLGYPFQARRFGWKRILDAQALAEALREAEELAGGRVEDEPAALLFALTRRGKALGAAWAQFPLLVAQNFARDALGTALRLDVGDVELENLRLRIAHRGAFEAATPEQRRALFEQLRAFVAAGMRPLRGGIE